MPPSGHSPKPNKPLTRRQLLAQVKAGSTAHIWEFHGSFKQEDCSLDLLRATLGNLRSGAIPDIKPGDQLGAETHPVASAAAASLFLLTKVAHAFRDVPELKVSAVTLIISAMEPVLEWVNFCLDFGVPRSGESEENVAYTLQPQLLYALLLTDERIVRAALESASFLRTVFRVWTAKNTLKGRHEAYWDFRPTGLQLDPIVHSALMLVEGERGDGALAVGREILAQDLALPFAKATMRRALQVCNCLSEPTLPRGLHMYAAGLIQLVRELTTPTDDGELDPIRKCFEEVHYIRRLTAMFDKLTTVLVTRKRPPHPDPEETFVKLTESVLVLLGVIFTDGPYIAWRISSFIKGGGIPLIPRLVIETNDEDNRKATTLATALSSLLPFSTWSCVARQLADLSKQRPTDPSMERMGRHPQHKPLWEAFWFLAGQRISVYQRFCNTNGVVICDNPLCPRDHRTFSQNSLKQCSRCSSVTYCSVPCQRRDWNHRHREECPHARAVYLARQETGEVYGHNARAFHIQVVEALCEERFFSICSRLVGNDRRALQEFHPIFECRDNTGEDRAVLFKDHATPESWMHKLAAPLVEKYLWPRMKSLGEDFTERMKGSDMRLAEAVFPFGPRTDICVYVLLKQTGDQFKAVYSIPRIAPSDKPYHPKKENPGVVRK